MKDNKKKPQTNLRPYVLCPCVVRIGRLELPLREELDPKSSAATNYAISARRFSGATCGIRTHDLRNHNPALYQLS